MKVLSYELSVGMRARYGQMHDDEPRLVVHGRGWLRHEATA
jgi:hypothetical protein